MSATAQFIVGAEGLDIYSGSSGGTAIGNAFPWYQTNATYQGLVTSSAGAFSGNGLSFAAAAANQSGMELQFNSTMQILKDLASAGGSGAFGVSGWIEIGTPVADGTDILLAVGPSANEAEALPILGLNNSATGGLSLVLPSNTSNIATSPHLLSVTPGYYAWIGVYFSYQPNGQLLATLCLNGGVIYKDLIINWPSDVFSASEVVNRLKFYSAVTAPWTIDDVIIQAVSSADALWPAPATLTPEVLPHFTPRQISAATATANGATDQMTPSGAQPNYQSATDASGTNYVTATAINQTDLYDWTVTASDVTAVVYRGQSNRYNQVSAAQSVAGVTATMAQTSAGPNEFIGISENDGTNQWTQSSIEAAQFGQTSHA